MASLTLRSAVGRPLTNSEVDANFSALNLELGQKLVASLNLLDLPNPAQARSNLGLGNVENKSSATIRGELTSGNVTGALGYTPLSTGGGSIAYLGINNSSALNLKGAGSGTYNTSWIYSDTTITSWEAPKTTDAPGGSRVPLVLTWRGGYASEGGLRLTGGSSGELGGNTILHAGNYSSYALPLSGGDVSGATRFNSRLTMGGYNNNNGYISFNNAGTFWGLIGNYGQNDWRLAYGPQDSIAGWSLKWDASGNVSVNGTLSAGGSISTSSAMYVNGYTVLNSQNFSSYSPPLNGIGAYGFWDIASRNVHSYDNRSTNDQPSGKDKGLYADFKERAAVGMPGADLYAGVLTFRSYGNGSDLSGGPVLQIGHTEQRLYVRFSAGAGTWNSWRQIVDTDTGASLNTGLTTKRSILNWFQWGGNPGGAYMHIKTNLWCGGSPNGNSAPTMSMFHIKGYTYDAQTINSIIGFHNWSGGIYSLAITNAGSRAAGQGAYASSDGYVVLVINTGTSYPGISIDYHQSFPYTFQPVVVTAYTSSASATGVY